MTKHRQSKSEDAPESTPEEVVDVPQSSSHVGTNAGPDAISGTVANSKAEAKAPKSLAGPAVDTNGGK